MGTFRVSLDIGDLQGSRFETVEAPVDTGATYLTIPRPLLESLGVHPLERRLFRLGDGRTVEYEVGIVSLRIDQRTLPVLCVFGDSTSRPLLGAVALETFGLAADPVGRRLVPVPGLLM
jgi:clan AA aspartic protease